MAQRESVASAVMSLVLTSRGLARPPCGRRAKETTSPALGSPSPRWVFLPTAAAEATKAHSSDPNFSPRGPRIDWLRAELNLVKILQHTQPDQSRTPASLLPAWLDLAEEQCESGLASQLIRHAYQQIEELNLPERGLERSWWGRFEVELILDHMAADLVRGGCVAFGLQKIALLQIVFLTGLRIGSLVATDKKDRSRLRMLCSDVSFHKEPSGYTTTLCISHLKWFQTPDKHEGTPHLPAPAASVSAHQHGTGGDSNHLDTVHAQMASLDQGYKLDDWLC
ncbi:uncharacterized protein PSFLO_00135 [Pseudozyma flocculosa]|uniref:Uncharacterized protein n=1 Tax=Pseudozyma flocculosa TaxID=84751 RepID=A0A5C3EQL8_9BASI|nr:uncharacterized protein PSFLO_00135 [Pseudozyma flocculosa]